MTWWVVMWWVVMWWVVTWWVRCAYPPYESTVAALVWWVRAPAINH
ncbi:hypothetical protein ACOJCT_003546 [Cronobacter dublinensis]